MILCGIVVKTPDKPTTFIGIDRLNGVSDRVLYCYCPFGTDGTTVDATHETSIHAMALFFPNVVLVEYDNVPGENVNRRLRAVETALDRLPHGTQWVCVIDSDGTFPSEKQLISFVNSEPDPNVCHSLADAILMHVQHLLDDEGHLAANVLSQGPS